MKARMAQSMERRDTGGRPESDFREGRKVFFPVLQHVNTSSGSTQPSV
jgi:hypothetical protein